MEEVVTCAGCQVAQIAKTPGRRKLYCDECVRLRKNAKMQAIRAAKKKPSPTGCLRCGKPLPEGSRADRKWCGSSCQTLASRSRSASEKKPRRSAAKAFGPPEPRNCLSCSALIVHLHGKAKFCGHDCGSKWWASQNRDAYNAKGRKWQASEKGKAYRRDYQQRNAKKRQEWARKARQENPERYARYWKQWSEANPQAVKEVGLMRRARKLGNPDSVGVSVRDWERMVRIYSGRCAYCRQVPEVMHMDHVMPLSKGGAHRIGNVVPACPSCNSQKHAMLLSAWRYRNGNDRIKNR